MATKKYYTLLSLVEGKWFIQFGDYSKDVVNEEKEDSYPNCKCKIITTSDSQEAIQAKVNELNKGV